MTTAILEVRNLVKHYPNIKAVNGVDFSLKPGTCFGLLGPNGAGKTTTVEILEGIHSATSGEVLYKGKPIDKQFHEEVGIMFQSTALQDYITVRETLEMFANLYSENADLDELILHCDLTDYIDQDNRQLSGGQRQRLLLALALVNNPNMIFLDEPTTGLDPKARRNFWDLIESIKAQGKTILLTTHYMDEAYVLCDEIAIMDHGKIIAQGEPKNLLKSYFHDVILQIPEDDIINHDPLPFTLSNHNGMINIATDDVTKTIKELLDKNISLAHLQIRSRNLDDLFLEITGNEIQT